MRTSNPALLAAAVALVACLEEDPDGPSGVSWYPPVRFAFPLAERELFEPPMGVDHDPDVYEGVERAICINSIGEPFPNCYDEHDGSDYLLIGDWEQMDAGSATIQAAADGVVVSTEDGHYDRCHGDFGSFDSSCDGHSGTANSVIVEHQTPVGTVQTWYWHMMKDSVAVEVGEEVACGDVLGIVGSSGRSSQPHLHFELQLDGASIDPYAGPYSQDTSWWTDQGEEWELPSPDCYG